MSGWDYFDLEQMIMAAVEQKPICQTCYKSVPAKRGITSNSLAYLKEHHPELYAEALTLQKSKETAAQRKTQNQLKQARNSQQ